MVFEMNSKDNVQLGSGGRYDELVALIGGDQAVPAVGFAYYLDQIFKCITSPSPDLRQTIYVAIDDANIHTASTLAVTLRAHDMTVVLMPADFIDAGQTVIHIDSEGQIHFSDQQFTMSTIDSLITAIRQKANVE
jgi:histidyl-tRNA synthetase